MSTAITAIPAADSAAKQMVSAMPAAFADAAAESEENGL